VDFVKCKLCRAPFFSYGSRLCPQCQEQTDNDFIIVRDYIYDHPNQANVDDIAEATGVSEKSIIYLLEENRLTATGALATAAGLRCQICGRNITAGALCESCKAALSKDLDSAATTLNEKKAPKHTPTLISGSGRKYNLTSEHGKK
jgi:predicted amidophosphoribosyltransferase